MNRICLKQNIVHNIELMTTRLIFVYCIIFFDDTFKKINTLNKNWTKFFFGRILEESSEAKKKLLRMFKEITPAMFNCHSQHNDYTCNK